MAGHNGKSNNLTPVFLDLREQVNKLHFEEIRRRRAEHAEQEANDSSVPGAIPSSSVASVPVENDPLLTLDQIAAIINHSKESLRYYRKSSYRGPRMPDPDLPGGHGRAAFWLWSRIQPWLEQVFGFKRKEYLPTGHRV